MGWIKAHLTVVIVSGVSFVALVMMVLGIVLSDVSTSLAEDARLVSSLRSTPRVNQDVLEQARQDQRELSKKLDEIIQRATERGTAEREPLTESVFADKTDVDKTAVYAFRNAYRRVHERLLEKLKAKDAPDEPEYTMYLEDVQREREREEKQKRLGLGEPGQATEEPAQPLDNPFEFTPNRPQGQRQRPGQGESGAKEESAELRREFNVIRAHEIYCYASLESLDRRTSITNSTSPAELEDIWYAQMSLWLQEDVVAALAELNEKAAADLEAAGQDAWVGVLPVKHLISFRMSDYVASGSSSATGSPRRQSGSGRTSSGQGAGLPGGPDEVFTNRSATPIVDVIYFKVELIVDANQMLKVINAISEKGYYTPVDVSYEALRTNPRTDDYIYGSDPVVKLDVVYEASLLRAAYEQWMPEVVATGIQEGTAKGGSPSGGGSPYLNKTSQGGMGTRYNPGGF